MNGMFRDASKFNQPIGGWNVAAVTDMGVLFSNARAFGQDVAKWNVQRVASMTGRAPQCAAAQELDRSLLRELMSPTICPRWRRMQVRLTQRSSVSPALCTARGARRCKRPTQRLEQHACATRSIWSWT
jgi:surface protein